MKPVNQYVLVKPFPPSEFTDGGLIVPDSVKKVSNKVKVIAVGNGSPKQPMQFVEGQTVFRVKSWGTEIEIDGDIHYIMSQDSIIAIESN